MADSRLSPFLTASEIDLLRDILNGVWLAPEGVLTPWGPGNPDFLRDEMIAEVVDAIELDAVDRKWDVNAPALLAKLAQLEPDGASTLLADIEAFWQDAPHRPPASGETLEDALLGRYDPGEGGAIIRAAATVSPAYGYVSDSPARPPADEEEPHDIP